MELRLQEARPSRKAWLREYRTPLLFIVPYLIVFFLFTILPVLVSIVLGFTDFNVLEMPKFIGLDNYIRLFFRDSVFVTDIKNTIILALILGPGGYMLSMLFAWFISNLSPKIRAVVT